MRGDFVSSSFVPLLIGTLYDSQVPYEKLQVERIGSTTDTWEISQEHARVRYYISKEKRNRHSYTILTHLRVGPLILGNFLLGDSYSGQGPCRCADLECR